MFWVNLSDPLAVALHEGQDNVAGEDEANEKHGAEKNNINALNIRGVGEVTGYLREERSKHDKHAQSHHYPVREVVALEEEGEEGDEGEQTDWDEGGDDKPAILARKDKSNPQ